MNKIFLTGRLTRDPELRTTQTGKNVAAFSLAVDRGYGRRGEAQGSEQPTADFFSCGAWAQHADFVHKYLQKGSPILVEGRLQTRSYQAKDGAKRNVTEVVVSSIEFMGPKPGTTHGAARSYGQSANAFGQQSEEEIPF